MSDERATDITEHLRSSAADAPFEDGWEHMVAARAMTEAADTIDALRADLAARDATIAALDRTVEDLSGENEALRGHIRALNDCGVDTIARRNATIEELRAALAPFAAEGNDLTEYADSRPDWLPIHYLDPWHEKAAFTVGDVRRAAALLEGETDGS